MDQQHETDQPMPTAFPSIQKTQQLQGEGNGREWPKHMEGTGRSGVHWDNMSAETRGNRRGDSDGTVKMASHYFFISKAGPVSHLRRALVEDKLEGNTQMVREYNRHGREVSRVVPIIWDQEVEPEFLRPMQLARIRQIESGTDPLELLTNNRQ